jgi:hypothetical protein
MPPGLSTASLVLLATRVLDFAIRYLAHFFQQPFSSEDFMTSKVVFELVFVKGQVTIGTSLRIWDIKSLLLVETLRKTKAFGLWSRQSYRLKLIKVDRDIDLESERLLDLLRANADVATVVNGDILYCPFVKQRGSWGIATDLVALLQNSH